MNKKAITSIGIEYDHFGIRAAKVQSVRLGNETKNSVETLLELNGDYAREEGLLTGLVSLAGQLGVKPAYRVVTCVSGRQVFVSQVKFKELPKAEMKKSLRAEIRKNLTFESAGSVLDYQVMGENDLEKKSLSDVTVTAVSRALIDFQVSILKKAGLEPGIVDVLPAAIANAYWAARVEAPAGAHVMVHFSPDLCTLVIDGNSVPFYTRSIFFQARELFGPQSETVSAPEKVNQLEVLGEELRRSLSYYTTNHGVADFGTLYPIGNYVGSEELLSFLHEKSGLEVEENALLKRLENRKDAIPGKFDVALALALRGSENL
jgi:Tfp pilus assembly PilM family ATPase